MKVKMNVKMQVNTVDGRNPAPVDTVNIPSFTRVFMHPRWLFGFSSINTMLACWWTPKPLWPKNHFSPFLEVQFHIQRNGHFAGFLLQFGMLKTAILYQPFPNKWLSFHHSTRRQSFSNRDRWIFLKGKKNSLPSSRDVAGVMKFSQFREDHFQCKYMVVLRDYPCNTALCWVGNSSWPLFFVDQKNGASNSEDGDRDRDRERGWLGGSWGFDLNNQPGFAGMPRLNPAS